MAGDITKKKGKVMLCEYDESWEKLAEYIEGQSEAICRTNGCSDDGHKCGSTAYIAADGTLIDICIAEYFVGWCSSDREEHGELTAIDLPWSGSGIDLHSDVLENFGNY